jgi:hypothetical protein
MDLRPRDSVSCRNGVSSSCRLISPRPRWWSRSAGDGSGVASAAGSILGQRADQHGGARMRISAELLAGLWTTGRSGDTRRRALPLTSTRLTALLQLPPVPALEPRLQPEFNFDYLDSDGIASQGNLVEHERRRGTSHAIAHARGPSGAKRLLSSGEIRTKIPARSIRAEQRIVSRRSRSTWSNCSGWSQATRALSRRPPPLSR